MCASGEITNQPGKCNSTVFSVETKITSLGMTAMEIPGQTGNGIATHPGMNTAAKPGMHQQQSRESPIEDPGMTNITPRKAEGP